MTKTDEKEEQLGTQYPAKDTAGTEASGAEAATAVPSPPSGRVKAFMLAKYPDREWKNDAELESSVADWLEEAEKSLEGYRMADETIRRVGEEYPELLAIAADLAKEPGLPLGVAIRRNIDEEDLEVTEDDPGYDALCKNREERSKRNKAKEAYQQRLDKNLEESREIVQQYLADNEMSEGEAAALGKYVDSIMEDYLDGRVTSEVLNMFRNAMNYQKDVEDAREVGKTEGMNAKIDAERQRKQAATDGLPGPGSSTGQLAVPKAAEPGDILDEILARGEKRRRLMD